MFRNPFKKQQETEENDTGIYGYGNLRDDIAADEGRGFRIPRSVYTLAVLAALGAAAYYAYPLAKKGLFGEDVAYNAALAEVKSKRLVGEAADAVKNAVDNPRVLDLAAPAYPAAEQNREGLVTYKVRYADDGAFRDAKLVSGTGSRALDQAALDAIRQSRLTDPLAAVRSGKRELFITCGFQKGLSECGYK